MPIVSGSTAVYRTPLAGGDAGVSQTVDQMRNLVNEAITDPSIIRLAKDIVRGVPAFDDTSEAQALYNWVRQNIRFTKDPVNKETLYPPTELLQIKAGDCDDISMLLGTLLMAIGYPARLMTVAANGDEFSHVYVEGQINGQWIPMDPARSDSQFGVAPPSYTRARWWSLSDSSQGDLPGTLGHYQRYKSFVSGMGTYGARPHRTVRHRTMAFMGTPPQQEAVNDLTNNGYNPATVNQLIAMGATNEQLQALPFPTDPTSMQNAVNALVAQLGGTAAPATVAPAPTAAAPASGAITSSTIATVDQGIADIIRASSGMPASPYSYSSGPYASFQTVNSPGLITAGYPAAAAAPSVAITGSSDWLLIAGIGLVALMLMRHK